MMQAIILAGGLGTRLKGVVSDLPKAMAPVAGKPFLEHLIILLKLNGIKNILLLTGYKSDIIKAYFKDGSNWNVLINYSKESIPLGTAGALFNAWEHIDNNFILLNGDTIFNIDYNRANKFVQERNIGFLIILKEMSDIRRYGYVNIDHEYSIKSFAEKNETESKDIKGMINGGIYYIKKELLEKYYAKWDNNFVSLEKDIFPNFLKEEYLYGLDFKEDFIDIGIPEDYNKAQTYIPEIIRLKSEI